MAPRPAGGRGMMLFNEANIFSENQNFTAATIEARLAAGENASVRAYLANFLFFHKARPAYDLFEYLERLGDDGTHTARKGVQVVRAYGFECTAYAARHDITDEGLREWVPFNATDCAADLAKTCARPPK